jgi:peptidoglycan-N-acetylglucosamine deacetylase
VSGSLSGVLAKLRRADDHRNEFDRQITAFASSHPYSVAIIGRQITPATRPWLVWILRDGDMIGDHTWSHRMLPSLTASGIRRQLLGTVQQMRHMTGFRPCLLRPHYGAYDSRVVAIATSLGLRNVLWSIDPKDWSRPGVSVIISRVLVGVAPGRIIIMHDGGGDRRETVNALPTILAALARRHYRVVTVETLLHARLITA